ncbi:hypothetical protein FB451DRAFT_1535804 [Mycena latifolia]|nr:hypothetical protein FB451DRAFT_1535804 [Mycena latifolia]
MSPPTQQRSQTAARRAPAPARAPAATPTAARRSAAAPSTANGQPTTDARAEKENQRSTGKQAPSVNKNKDNNSSNRARVNAPPSRAQRQDSSDNEAERNYRSRYVGDDEPRDGDDEDDDEAPVRGRKRRLSEKQAQLVEEMEAAEARRTAKADKAVKTTKKRELRAAGEVYEEEMEPRRDDLFTSRTVPTRPTATKVLAQRNSKVPPPPTFPSATWRATSPAHVHSSSAHRREDRYDQRDTRDRHYVPRDNDHRGRYTSRSRSPVHFRGRSPSPPRRSPSPPPVRNINGGVAPRHLQVDLRISAPRDDGSPTRSERSVSPSAGDKRSRSPHEDVRVVQAQRTGAATGRPKAKDFDDVTQEVISLAITRYRCFLSAKHAFPDHALELEFLRKAWAEACRELNIVMELSPTISRLITNRGSHLRGELKTKMRPRVELTYGFTSGENKKTIARNRQLAEDLKEDLTFTFKDIKERKGIYRHPLFQKAINAMWFANRRDEGPTYPEFFNPFPAEGLALVFTVAVNLIDEWATGIRTDIPFTANEYRSTYEAHLAALREFEESTKPHKILENILVRLHNIGRFHSGAQPLAVVTKSVLNKTDLAAAIKEYQEDSETETEGEEGEHDDN